MGIENVVLCTCLSLPGLAHFEMLRRAAVRRHGRPFQPALPFGKGFLTYDDALYEAGLGPREVRLNEWLMRYAYYGNAAVVCWGTTFVMEREAQALFMPMVGYIAHLLVRLKLLDKRERFGPLPPVD